MPLNPPTDAPSALPVASSLSRWTPRSANVGLWFFLIVLISFFAVTTQGFFTTTNALNVLRQMSVLAIAAFGSSFVMFSGGLDLSVGSTAALAGVIAAMFARDNAFSGSAELSWLIGVLVGAAIGVANGLIVVRLRINPIITTLGTLAIVRGFAFVLTGGVSLFGVPDSFQGLGRGFVIPGILPVPMFIMFLLLC